MLTTFCCVRVNCACVVVTGGGCMKIRVGGWGNKREGEEKGRKGAGGEVRGQRGGGGGKEEKSTKALYPPFHGGTGAYLAPAHLASATGAAMVG